MHIHTDTQNTDKVHSNTQNTDKVHSVQSKLNHSVLRQGPKLLVVSKFS